MIRIGRGIWFFLVFAAMVPPAAGFPMFLQIYQNDPFRNPELDGCSVCHVNPAGGEIRNEFGLAFFETQTRITPLLRTLAVSEPLCVRYDDARRYVAPFFGPGKHQAGC